VLLERLTYGRLFQNIPIPIAIASMSSLVSQTVVFSVSCGFSHFHQCKTVEAFCLRTFAFLSPYRRLKGTISYPDVLHRSKDQPFKTFHVFIPFFLCLILYLFAFYYLALTSAAFAARTNIPHIIYSISTNIDLYFEFSQIFLQTN
jgi:hypothetical protein